MDAEGSYVDGRPIAAIATPLGESALGVLRVSGRGSVSLLGKAFSRPEALESSGNARAVHGWIRGGGGERIDEVVVLVWRSPAGYTGEDGADVMCHGSPAAVSAVLEAILAVGFRRALPGEFTLRAFMNGKLDLTRAEAAAEMSAARTERARKSAAARLSGVLEERVRAARESVLEALALAEMRLDYAEGEDDEDGAPRTDGLAAALAEIDSLRDGYATGRLAREGAAVVLLGPTNAGKSSLFNLFLKEDRAIVSEEHGTTRDYLEAWIELGGFPLRLIDTAGLRDTSDAVEREGIARALGAAETADVVLLLRDAAAETDASTGQGDSAGPDAGSAAGVFLARPDVAAKTIRVWSRADLSAQATPTGWLALSSVTSAGFKELESLILDMLRAGSAKEDGLEIASARQKRLLDAASASLRAYLSGIAAGEPLDALAPELRDCADSLGLVLGEGARADLLDEIFSRFCVGK